MTIVKRGAGGLLVSGKLGIRFVPQSCITRKFIRSFLPLMRRKVGMLVPGKGLTHSCVTTSLSRGNTSISRVVICRAAFPHRDVNLLGGRLSKGKLSVLTFADPSAMSRFVKTLGRLKCRGTIGSDIINYVKPIAERHTGTCKLRIRTIPRRCAMRGVLGDVVDCLTRGEERGW